jgi:hypothetical protein
MTHPLTRWVLIASIALAGIAVGGAAGYWLGAGVHTSQHRVLIRRELENLATIANALEALKSRDEAAVAQILESRMQRSVADLADLTLVRVNISEPELLNAVRLAGRYSEAHGLASTSVQARLVSQRLGSR